MFSRLRLVKAILALLLFCLVGLAGYLPHPVPHKHQGQMATTVSTPAVCAPSASRAFVMVFYHTTNGGEGFLCINQQLGAAPSHWAEQVLSTPVRRAYKACASGAPAIVLYSSYDDPAEQSTVDGTGTIDLRIPAGKCEFAQRLIGEAEMSVTSVVINPILDGTPLPPPPVALTHQNVPAHVCAAHPDRFFILWYAGGQQSLCFADAGIYILPHTLTRVVRVCGGVTSGEVIFESNPSNLPASSAIELAVGPLGSRFCVTPALLLGEMSITINVIAISPK